MAMFEAPSFKSEILWWVECLGNVLQILMTILVISSWSFYFLKVVVYEVNKKFTRTLIENK